MKYGYKAVDADGHVSEALIKWEEELPEQYRSFVVRTPNTYHQRDKQGRLVTGQLTPKDATFVNFKGVGRVPGPGHRSTHFHGPASDILSMRNPEVTGMWDPHARIKDMEKAGTWAAVLFPSHSIALPTWDNAGLAVAAAKVYNNWLASYCKPYPDRLFGLAVLPLQHPEAAAEELRRCVTELGFAGACVTSNMRNIPLSDPMFDTLWAEAARLKAPVGVHAATGSKGIESVGQDRFNRFIHTHMVSHPFEQICAVSAFILDGVLDRHPGLQVVFCEGQASWLPWWLYRMEEHMEKLRPQAYCNEEDPAEYFRKGRCFITCDSDEPAPLLNTVAETVGDNCICYASDYAHWDTSWPRDVELIAANPNISKEFKQKILVDNPARAFKIPLAGKSGRGDGKAAQAKAAGRSR